MSQTTNAQEYDRPIMTVDAVVFVMDGEDLKVVVQRREKAPFEGAYALPGGWIHTDKDENAEAAVRRVLSRKCGMGGFYLEQLQTFASATRDPRGWSASIAYVALLPISAFDPEEDGVELVDALNPGELAFDHAEILNAGLTRLRGKGAYSTLPAMLLGETFTMVELHRAYELALGREINQNAFRRKVNELRLLDEVDEKRQVVRGRPSQLYRLAQPAGVLDRSLGTS